MLRTFNLTDPGEGLMEAEIIAWRVSEGDEIDVNDVLVEVETAKSVVELPSPWAGTVKALLVSEGTTVEVGTPLVEIEDGQRGEDQPPETLVGYGPGQEQTRRRKRRRAEEQAPAVSRALHASFEPREPGHRADDVAPAEAVVAEPSGEELPEPGQEPVESQLVPVTSADGVRAKPTVRKYAKDLGVDLTRVTGTGLGGIITRADVEAAAAFRMASQGRAASGQTFQEPAQEHVSGMFTPRSDPFEGQATRRVPIKGVRKLTAENVTQSSAEHVHVTEWVTIDVTATMELVERLKLRREFSGLRISPLLVYAKAICLALQNNPDINTSWDEQAREIVYYRDVNLGIAAATPRGLMVPNIKQANQLNMLELCQAINNLVSVSKEGRLQPSDYSEGTFTITNVGVFGIDAGTPIINGKESAILCMGSIDRRPWVVGTGENERVEPRWVTTLALSFDHRNIDGEQGSKFLADVAEILHDPSAAMFY